MLLKNKENKLVGILTGSVSQRQKELGQRGLKAQMCKKCGVYAADSFSADAELLATGSTGLGDGL